jgi:hypothetical protein
MDESILNKNIVTIENTGSNLQNSSILINTDIIQSFNLQDNLNKLNCQSFPVVEDCSFRILASSSNLILYDDENFNLEKNKLLIRKKFNNKIFSSANNESKIRNKKIMIINNNAKNINDYIKLNKFVNSKNFDANMRNNTEFYNFIINHPYLKYINGYCDIINKYAKIKKEIILSRMKDNTTHINSPSMGFINGSDNEDEYDDYSDIDEEGEDDDENGFDDEEEDGGNYH